MPEFIIVRCVECRQFQIRQARKDARFCCVLCGAKQSVRKTYSRSASAGALRPAVQEFNVKAGLEQETSNLALANRDSQDAEQVDDGNASSGFWEELGNLRPDPASSVTSSKWDRFLTVEDLNDPEGSCNKAYTLGPPPEIISRLQSDTQLVLERPTRKRKQDASASDAAHSKFAQKHQVVEQPVTDNEALVIAQKDPDVTSAKESPAKESTSMWHLKPRTQGKEPKS